MFIPARNWYGWMLAVLALCLGVAGISIGPYDILIAA